MHPHSSIPPHPKPSSPLMFCNYSAMQTPKRRAGNVDTGTDSRPWDTHQTSLRENQKTDRCTHHIQSASTFWTAAHLCAFGSKLRSEVALPGFCQCRPFKDTLPRAAHVCYQFEGIYTILRILGVMWQENLRKCTHVLASNGLPWRMHAMRRVMLQKDQCTCIYSG